MASKRKTGPTPEAVETVLQRDGWKCVKCGHQIQGERGWDWSIQHRVGRGMGGSRAEWINLPANLLTVHGSGITSCHGEIEANPAAAMAYGWSVSRHADPTEIPVLVTTSPGGEATLPVIEWRLLDDEGSYQVTEVGANA